MTRAAAFAALIGCVIGSSLGCNNQPNPPASGSPAGSETVDVGVSQIAVGPATPAPSRPAPPPAPDAYGDPLPPGAVLRLGSERGKPAWGWKVTLLPDGKRLLAGHNYHELWRGISKHYTLYAVDGLRPIGEPVLAEVSAGGEFRTPQSVSADGRRIATTNINQVEVHDVATGKRILTIPKSVITANAASLSADGKRLAVGALNRVYGGRTPAFCAVWDVDAGKEVARVTVLQNNTCTGRLSPDGKTLITFGNHSDYKLLGEPDYPGDLAQIWDVDSGKQLACFSVKKRRVGKFSPDSRVVVLGSFSEPAVLLADARTGKAIHTLKPPAGGHGLGAFTPDGKVFGMVGGKLTTRWDVGTGRLLGTTPRPAGLPARVAASQLAFDGPDRLVAVGVVGLALYAWDALGGKLLTPPPAGHTAPVRTVAFTPDGKEIRSGGDDGLVYRWDAATSKPLGQVSLRQPADFNLLSIQLSADGRRAVTFRGLFDLPGGQPAGDYRTALKPDAGASNWFPTPDGAYLLLFAPRSRNKSTRCVVYDVAARKKVGEVTLPLGVVRTGAALSPDHQRLYTAVTMPIVNNKNDVVVTGWEVATGRKLGEATLPAAGSVNGVAALGDRQVIVATGMGRVVLIDTETGAVARDIADPTRLTCEAITVSRDGKLLAVSQAGRPPAAPYIRAIRVYDLTTGAVRHTIPVITARAPAQRAAFSPPTINNIGVLADPVFLFNQTTSPLEVMAFSPDGTRLATPAQSSVLVWDLARIDAGGSVK